MDGDMGHGLPVLPGCSEHGARGRAFEADTQFWFVLGCSVLAFLLACSERGGCWGLKSYLEEDSLAKVPQRFSNRVPRSEGKA